MAINVMGYLSVFLVKAAFPNEAGSLRGTNGRAFGISRRPLLRGVSSSVVHARSRTHTRPRLYPVHALDDGPLKFTSDSPARCACERTRTRYARARARTKSSLSLSLALFRAIPLRKSERQSSSFLPLPPL